MCRWEAVTDLVVHYPHWGGIRYLLMSAKATALHKLKGGLDRFLCLPHQGWGGISEEQKLSHDSANGGAQELWQVWWSSEQEKKKSPVRWTADFLFSNHIGCSQTQRPGDKRWALLNLLYIKKKKMFYSALIKSTGKYKFQSFHTWPNHT